MKPPVVGAGAMAGWAAELGRAGRRLADALRLNGQRPNYGACVAHMQATHPDRASTDDGAFFRERQQARYGSKGRIGCCLPAAPDASIDRGLFAEAPWRSGGRLRIRPPCFPAAPP